jgi:hypothetical protein
VVATAFQLPRVCNLRYPFSPKSTPTDDVMISHFCGKPMAWGSSKTITTKSFTDESHMYNLIMCFNLFSLSHRNTITKARAKFLYAFMTKVSIDLSSIICKSLIEMHKYENKMSHLIYPCLITRLFTHLKITIPSNIPQLPQSTKPIGKSSIKRMVGQLKKDKVSQPNDPNGENNGAGSSSSTPSSADVMASLHAITGFQERIFNKLKEDDIVLAKMIKCLERIQKWTCDTPEREDNDADDLDDGEGEDDDDEDDEDASNDDDDTGANEGSTDADVHCKE